jgi:phosphoglycerate kinase
VALGAYLAGQFEGPMMRCLAAQLVVFSGIKIDKLDDLEAVIGRGSAKVIFTAGSLAMALKKAEAELAGKNFSLGVAEDPAHGDKPYFIPRERIEQAKRMLTEGRKKGVEFVLPVDFVLQHGKASGEIGAADQQFDIGPESSKVFAQAIDKFIAATSKDRKVAFHNGVFGMFEDARFEEGTRKFVGELKRLKDAGVEVYVGGGEGGTALERYGAPDHVTHTFTAGGTVLNALGSEPVPYLVAVAMAAKQAGR